MRFNKQELLAISAQPSIRYQKEGVLHIRDKQEGFFKRTDSLERWCRLRGNLLFISRTKDPWSEPTHVVVLENCQIGIDPPLSPQVFKGEGLFCFYLVFDGGFCQSLASASDSERALWINAIRTASLEKIRIKIISLIQCIEHKRSANPQLSIWPTSYVSDITDMSICELSMACDNLLCDIYGCRPNSFLNVEIYIPGLNYWVHIGFTEIIENSSNPIFLKTVNLRASDGISLNSKIKITVFDVRDRVSHTTVSLGGTYVLLGELLDTTRLRLPLISRNRATIGFLSLTSCTLKTEDRSSSTENTPSKSSLQNTQNWSHRRSQSLPPRLGIKMTLPNQQELKLFYSSVFVQTYHMHSGLGGDIGVYEFMAESRICFSFPCLLLEIWKREEQEMLQEVLGMGELQEPWCRRQVDLLDRHLQMLRLYSQAQEELQLSKNTYFKPSTKKFDRGLEFSPVNLHLQRMWVYNDTINKAGIYDWVTVGAFTAHSHESNNGGLLKLLQEMKESPIRATTSYQMITKISMTYDVIQAIKELREDVLTAMKALMKLARDHESNGMLPICEDLINKTRILLSLWDPILVEEALNFIEEYKLITVCSSSEEPSTKGDEQPRQCLSNYKKISQLLDLELESPETDEITSPSTQLNFEEFGRLSENFVSTMKNLCSINNMRAEEETDLHKQLHLRSKNYTEYMSHNQCTKDKCTNCNSTFCLIEPKNITLEESDETQIFSTTNEICNSTCANYYKPTEEPEPLDITQLNIEASVMCLVSKVKFLCGRCGSPAVRLRKNVQCLPKNVSTNKTTVTSANTEIDRKRNKFTDGLDLKNIADWFAELQPSMKKLRQAMDGLLKTARLAHSVFRLQVDYKTAQKMCDIQYRRDVCFSQALTSFVTALLTRLWSDKSDPIFISILSSLGPLANFEGLLSYHGSEINMWDDMSVAIEDLRTVMFMVIPCSGPISSVEDYMPKVSGNRSSLKVILPIPDALHSLFLTKQPVSFHVTPVFFNIGINEMATLAESSVGARTQHASNIDNFDRLNEYCLRYRKLLKKTDLYKDHYQDAPPQVKSILELMKVLKKSLYSEKQKNVEILQVSARICRLMKGFRFTSCKSAKDRTGMSVTLEQCLILSEEYHLSENEFQRALDCMRSEGCRRENVFKNTGSKKYAFNCLQVLALPKLYRPPVGTYGSGET